MKKIYSVIALAMACLGAQAQSSIPNGNFEQWNTATCDVPTGFQNSNAEAFYKCNVACNVVKTTDAYHGTYAVQLTTYITSDTCFGYVVGSSNPNGNSPCQWQGGTPFTQVPTGFKGYYKSNIASPDSGGVIVAFKNGTNCLGMYMYKFGGVHSTYTPFSFTFNPPIAGVPDTVVFAAVSSNVFGNYALAGSMLQLDSLSFIGAIQPVAFNGDFENWSSFSMDKPANWYINGGGNGGSGVSKTTDMYAGQYAAQLNTVQGDHNGIPVASAGQISTGYYLNNCSGPNCQKGGYTFTNQIDTLEFYYKYSPSGPDTANVNLNFKKNGSGVWGTGMNFTSTITSYTHVKVPFNIPTPVDTVIVSFQSGSWRDSALSYIGSVLKIDEVHFASQPLNTGIPMFDASVGMKVFPNPAANGDFVISNVAQFDLVRVLNVYGQEMNASIVKENNAAKIHMDAPGAYMVYVNARGKVTMLKVIVGKE